MPNELLIFISYASEDKPVVRRLCQRLRSDGFNLWRDEERLLPGQDWRLEIDTAMHASGAILLCFSSVSVAKEGFIQREFKRAMGILEEKPEGTIFVIPVRLDECEMPYFIQELQWVDFPAGYDFLVKALSLRAGDLTKPTDPQKNTEEKKMPAKRKTRKHASIYIEGGVHAQNAVFGDQVVRIAGRDLVEGDQKNTFNTFTQPKSVEEFRAILYIVQAQLEAMKQAGLSMPQKQMVEVVEEKIARAVEEVDKTQPLGKRIKTTLTEAKEYLDAIGGGLASAATLGTTIGGLLLAVGKLFGL